MSAAPDSVTLNSISTVLFGFHNSQLGVMSDGSHFNVVLRVITKLRNDSENDVANIVALFKLLALAAVIVVSICIGPSENSLLASF